MFFVECSAKQYYTIMVYTGVPFYIELNIVKDCQGIKSDVNSCVTASSKRSDIPSCSQLHHITYSFIFDTIVLY